MPKTIFINRFFYPDLSATSQLLTDLVLDMPANHISVEVVTSRNLYQSGQHQKGTLQLDSRIIVHHIWSTRFGRHGLMGRAIDYLSFYMLASLKLLQITEKNDVIIAKTDPPLIGIPAKLIARIRGAKLINWLQDIFPEIAVELNLFPKKFGLLKIVQYLRNRSLRDADANIVLGERMREKLVKWGIPAEKVHIIHNWADDSFIQPIPHSKNALRTSWGLTDKFVVGYSGNLGRAHEYQTIIKAAEALKNNTDIIFLWIGGGVKLEALKKEVKSRKLTNFIFKEYQNRKNLQVSLNAADIHLTVLSPSLEGLVVPSKFYGTAAAGKPSIFIGDTSGEIANLLKKHQCGLSIKPGDSTGLTQAIELLYSNSSTLKTMGVNAHKALSSHYSRKLATQKWRKIIQVLLADDTLTKIPLDSANISKNYID